MSHNILFDCRNTSCQHRVAFHIRRAVRLDAPRGLTSDSPVFSFLRTGFWLSQISFTFLTCFNVYCITFGQHFLFNSCSTMLRVWSNSNAAWASCGAFALVQNVLAQVQSFYSSVTDSSCGWIVGPCGTLLGVAFHGLSTHKFKICKSQALSPSRRLTQRVLTAPACVSKRNSSVRSSLPTKIPRIHLRFNLAPSSEWSRPKQTSPKGTTSPLRSLPRRQQYGVHPDPST